VVIATELKVRKGPGQKHSAIGSLYAGNIVKVLRTRTLSWSLVEFEEGDVQIQGWVFSRYLQSLSGCISEPCGYTEEDLDGIY
jgi:uncharacterized protein YraI